jgi:Ca2+-transporting ATPase
MSDDLSRSIQIWINLVTDGLPALCLATDPIDSDVMKRRPRRPAERITSGGFLSTMLLTGVLTAGVSFGVYPYGLKSATLELARTRAFATLVFAELLRAFGGRSETKPVWRVRLLSNLNLLLVVALSFTLQIWSHHNALLGRFLNTVFMDFNDCLMSLTLSAIPLVVLELVKVIRGAVRQKPVTVEQAAPIPTS